MAKTMRAVSGDQGRQAWDWIVAHSERDGVLVSPRGLTVAQLEAACGAGALTAARRHCEGRAGLGTGALGGGGRGEVYPYAGGTRDVREWCREQGWDDARTEEYVSGYWLPRYGDTTSHYHRGPGQERPGDRICIHYPQVG